VAYTVQFIRREPERGSGRVGIIEGAGDVVSDVTTSGRFAPLPDEDMQIGDKRDLDIDDLDYNR
jgi:hypothetical protein